MVFLWAEGAITTSLWHRKNLWYGGPGLLDLLWWNMENGKPKCYRNDFFFLLVSPTNTWGRASWQKKEQSKISVFSTFCVYLCVQEGKKAATVTPRTHHYISLPLFQRRLRTNVNTFKVMSVQAASGPGRLHNKSAPWLVSYCVLLLNPAQLGP